MFHATIVATAYAKTQHIQKESVETACLSGRRLWQDLFRDKRPILHTCAVMRYRTDSPTA